MLLPSCAVLDFYCNSQGVVKYSVADGGLRIGLHTSIAGGLHLSLERAHALGCTAVQLFSHNPRGWQLKELTTGECGLFNETRARLDISPVCVHASYLINIATTKPDLRAKSVGMLRAELLRADALGADYLILHTGVSHEQGGRRSAIDGIVEALDGLDLASAALLLENTSGKSGDMASSMEGLAAIFHGTKERVPLARGVCIDTCHAFAAGYDFRAQGGVDAFARELDSLVGIANLKIVHLNDSKADAGTGKDRHEHIGRGFIGEGGLGAFLNHPSFKGLPIILETPRASDADDLSNLAAARGLILA